MAPAPTNGHNLTSLSQRRRGSRYTLQVPLDITVLRWGIPDTVPGRSLDLSPNGVAAILAGEFSPGEKVGVEIRLPQSENPLRTRALVRHHDKLRCGFEFVGLSDEQRKAIRTWAEKAQPGSATIIRDLPPNGGSPARGPESALVQDPPPPPMLSQRGWMFLVLSAAILLSVLWWRWHRGWEDLEASLPSAQSLPQAQAQVPAEVMEKLVRHRVDPEYPAAARRQNLEGVIPLDVLIGSDGSVLSVRALKGPQILAQAAVDALRWWRFEPYRIQGKAVVAETTVAVEFKP
jgi:TonB family protein